MESDRKIAVTLETYGRDIAQIAFEVRILDGERLVEKGVYVKMARGEMVRYLAEHNAQAPEDAQSFDRMDYRFSPERSTGTRYVFLRPDKRKKTS